MAADRAPASYPIRILGHPDPAWSAWFDGPDIVQEAGATTTLTGRIIDQAELLARSPGCATSARPCCRWSLFTMSRRRKPTPPNRRSRRSAPAPAAGHPPTLNAQLALARPSARSAGPDDGGDADKNREHATRPSACATSSQANAAWVSAVRFRFHPASSHADCAGLHGSQCIRVPAVCAGRHWHADGAYCGRSGGRVR